MIFGNYVIMYRAEKMEGLRGNAMLLPCEAVQFVKLFDRVQGCANLCLHTFMDCFPDVPSGAVSEAGEQLLFVVAQGQGMPQETCRCRRVRQEFFSSPEFQVFPARFLSILDDPLE